MKYLFRDGVGLEVVHSILEGRQQTTLDVQNPFLLIHGAELLDAAILE
jgi:hypothetical protein